MVIGATVRGQRGQATILVGLLMVALIAAAGLAIDVGNLYLVHRRMQATADLAALAGAQTLRVNGATTAEGIATAIADQNGEKSPAATVVAHSPPLHGGFAGKPRYLEVEISRQVETYFIRVLGFTQVPVTARAVAVVDLDNPPYAILSLSPTASPAIELTGTGDLVTMGAGIMANSTASPAIDHTGTGTVTIDGAVNAAGTIRDQAVYTINTPVMQSQQPPIPDPFRDLSFTIPSVDNSTFWDVTVQNPNAQSDGCVKDGAQYPTNISCTQAFRPGIYRDTLVINQSGNWSLAPGIYVLEKGMKITGGNVSGLGVFFYIKGGGVEINTNGTIYFEPPATPPAGMPKNLIFFQARDNTDGNNLLKIVASATTKVVGTIYVPTNKVEIDGGASGGVVSGQVIADTVKLAGHSEVSVDYEAGSVAAERGSTLVE